MLSRFIISATTLTHPSNERSHDIELELGRLVGDYAEYFAFDRVELLDSTGHLALSVEDAMVEIDHDGHTGVWADAAALGFASAHRLLIGNRTGEMHLFHRHEGSTIDQLDSHSLFAEVLLSALHNGREVGQLRFAAAHDALTGLPNRVGFRAGLHRQLGSSVSALLFIDLDGFKAINDELGHHVGDAVLAETARRLQQHLRPGDLAARLGGDEFAVAVATNVAGHLDALSSRLSAAIEQPMEIGPFEVSVGASIGFASLRPDDSLDDLMAAADQAMYEIKTHRRTQRQRR
ncbi:MAG: GGDEF domain-containing protein [Acidimicrobiales bacterium]